MESGRLAEGRKGENRTSSLERNKFKWEQNVFIFCALFLQVLWGFIVFVLETNGLVLVFFPYTNPVPAK